jgi:hypothetical protein
MDSSKKIFYSNHAVKQMFQRKITTHEVEYVLKNGETIQAYPKDKPYPSKLLLAFYEQRPLHVVCSYNKEEKITIIITVYEPTNEIWENNFKTRKKQ